MCVKETAPSYLDCENNLSCIDAGEQEIIVGMCKGYPTGNETESYNSQDLLFRSWCNYTRGAIPK
jgi:hypothetical protein